MVDENSWQNILNTEGWYAAPRKIKNEPSLKELLAKLSPRRIVYSQLSVNSTKCARPNTLSHTFGLNQFPFHTDAASAVIPPKYIILFAPPLRTTNTLVLSPLKHSSLDAKTCQKAAFRVFDSHRAHSYKFWNLARNLDYIRFNPLIMQPINNEAEKVAAILKNDLDRAIEISWRETRFLVINNHKILHSREKVKESDAHSYLRRIMVWN
ncbi:MAG: hypothetical protein P8P30_10165 [Rickettsiales bacterium]|nr:hypothetical protein [Rickettsiales bacterium]